ncbi:MAG: tetratricopeptide repeat protein [Pseudomonadota bacterium]
MRKALRSLSLAAAFAFGAASADQTDPGLDAHFETLRLAPDETVALEAERSITSLWNRGATPALTSQLAEARKLIESWSFDQARKLLDELTRRAPRFAEAWNQRATLHYIERRYDASLADVAITLKLEPRHFGALAGLGEIRLRLGDLNGALTAFESALAVHPRLPGLRNRVEALRAMDAHRAGE